MHSLTVVIGTFNFLQGDFFQLKVDNEGPQFTKMSSYGRHFVRLCLVNPSGDHIATLNASGCINTWAVRNGNLVCYYYYNKHIVHNIQHTFFNSFHVASGISWKFING
jgi:hypothetical protein